MSSRTTARRGRRVAVTALVAAVAMVVLAACGSSDGSAPAAGSGFVSPNGDFFVYKLIEAETGKADLLFGGQAADPADNFGEFMAWDLQPDELLGSATYQVRRFHMIAPARAAMMMCSSICPADFTISLPMVLATPVLYIAPAKFKKAAMMMASLGRIARVDTEVAMAFAVSWKPLMKPKTSANPITVKINN